MNRVSATPQFYFINRHLIYFCRMAHKLDCGVTMKQNHKISKTALPVYDRIRRILDSARTNIARSVNTTQVVANWLIGREIVEDEQHGERRAGYGQELIKALSKKLICHYGKGFSVNNLEHYRDFYLTYPKLLEQRIPHAVRGKSENAHSTNVPKGYAVRSLSAKEISATLPRKSRQPGVLNPNLSWTHYRTLLRVEKPEARSFYEIESTKNSWSARELERQINSLLYERLALSRDKQGVLKLALKGNEIQKPTDIFKDPVFMEFVDVPKSPRLVESNLEQSIIDNLQSFLLEMGRGFAFVSRQERLTLEGDHFYIDLVFYHTVLKCYVIIEIKMGKLTHQDIGQLQLYVNYYDRERRTHGDHPTLGLILCADKNDTVVKYTLGEDQNKTIFASRYKLHLPSEAELKAEVQREVRFFSAPK